jgi:hypothetical protein
MTTRSVRVRCKHRVQGSLNAGSPYRVDHATPSKKNSNLELARRSRKFLTNSSGSFTGILCMAGGSPGPSASRRFLHE